MESRNKQSQKDNLNKKGLGWLPDYPDLRDYNLDNKEVINQKLRFKIEEKTQNFENLVKELIDLVSDSFLMNSINQNRINEFKNKVWGNVLFAEVKIHKFLRYISKAEQDKQINEYYLVNPIKYESILSKQILELKKYLGILYMEGYLSILEKNDKLLRLKEPKNLVYWMRKEEYDEETKLLVKDFQYRSHIMQDGIVGLETYTAFNEHFSSPNTNEFLRIPDNNIEPRQSPRSLSKIKFFSVTSLISSTEFEIIINILKSKVIDQISKEYLDNKILPTARLEENIFEYNFLQIIKVDNYKLFQEIVDSPKEDITNDEYVSQIIKRINQICSKNDKDNNIFPRFSDIVNLLQNSYVTEPIFSVIALILSPLAQWRNQTWEETIRQGFDEFERIANNSQAEQNNNCKRELEYSKEKLVENAIFQVISLLKQEIYSIVDEKYENSEKDKSAIFVYFLLKKYLNRFKRYISDAETEIAKVVDKQKEPASNIFDKQEVFEIELIVNYETSSSNTNNHKPKQIEELFPNLGLHIPIILSNNYLQELSEFNQRNKLCKKRFFLLPSVIDLSFWCSPVRDQGSLNSCTAFAAIALLEYFENRNFGKSTDASPLFLYKTARQKMNVQGDVGASIRETMKVLALFGVPPEESWPYEEDKVDEDPPPYCYAYAQNYKTLKYFLLDYAGITTESLLFQIKAVLAAGFPCIFGLTLYTSVYEETNSEKGHIPYPDANKDKVVGGHTAVVVGYDDYKFILCANRKHYSRGAFLIRNSWGTNWGVKGYGWLPYDYVLAGLTAAWWSLLKAEWFDESNFGQSRQGGDGNKDKPD